ncbi:MAG: hypothetical protein WC979_09365 [Candidatus Pacearchaeota archaeon]|jgi:hypothetical protein
MELKKVVIESILVLLLIGILVFLGFNLMDYFKTDSQDFQVISSNSINVSRAYTNENQLIISVTNKESEEISGITIKIFNRDGEAYSKEFNDPLLGFESKSLVLSPSPFGPINNYRLIQLIAKTKPIIIEPKKNDTEINKSEINLTNNYNLEGIKAIDNMNTISKLRGVLSQDKFNSSFEIKKACSKWGDCIGNIQKRSCINENFIGKMEEIKDCSSENYQAESFHDIPVKKTNCKPNFQCGEWSSCKDYYNLEDVANKNILLSSYRSRTCLDVNGCLYEKTEKEPCKNLDTFLTKISKAPNEKIMNFYDTNQNEILNMSFNSLKKSLDLNIVFNEVSTDNEESLTSFISDKKMSYLLIIIFILVLAIIIFLIIQFYKKFLVALPLKKEQ